MRVTAALLACAALTLAAPTRAETLRDALAQIYRTNPTLTGARAQLRAVDEGVPIARAGGLPQANSTASITELPARGGSSISREATAGVSLSVPIYSGGAVRNGIKSARERIAQGRATLRSTEAGVFVDGVGAYMNVIRDEAIVDLNRGNVRVLQTNLEASQDRFQVGDLTRTDVAQSEARLEVARSQLQSAMAQLDASRENYLQIVGAAPGKLDPPPPLPEFPATPDDAVDVAIANNPDLESAKAAGRAAGYDVRVARASRLPRIAAVASGDYVNYLNSLSGLGGIADGSFTGGSNSETSVSVGAQLSLPLYQGGLPAAQVRRAQATESQALEQITAIEREVVAQARTNYSLYVAALAVIKSSDQAVSANELALEGVRAENTVGTRNVLDVLNAEQELLNSRVQLVTARHDAYVEGFALLAALGRAEAKDLGLDGGALYDPTLNARRVNRSISDWNDDPAPAPVATSTVGVASPTQQTVQQNKAAAQGQPGVPPPPGTPTPLAPAPIPAPGAAPIHAAPPTPSTTPR